MFFIILYKYLESLKWTILIVGFLYYFRNEIKGILNRPFSISRNGTIVNFPITQQGDDGESEENEDLKNITPSQIEEIKRNLETKESEVQDKDKQIFQLTLEKHFEYTYRIIFRSQIQLLQNLQVINDGFAPIQLDEYFQNLKNSTTEFSVWNTDSYLKFLFDQNLILKDAVTGKVKITPVGNLFLQYLIISGYNFTTEKNF